MTVFDHPPCATCDCVVCGYHKARAGDDSPSQRLSWGSRRTGASPAVLDPGQSVTSGQSRPGTPTGAAERSRAIATPANDVADDELPEDDEPTPFIARLRARGRGRHTLDGYHAGRLSLEERAIAAAAPPPPARPRTRGECIDGPRPCPWVGCKWHLYLDITATTGHIKVNRPEIDPWDMDETCALDIADGGGATLERVGELVAITRERVRQIEMSAAQQMRMTVLEEAA